MFLVLHFKALFAFKAMIPFMFFNSNNLIEIRTSFFHEPVFMLVESLCFYRLAISNFVSVCCCLSFFKVQTNGWICVLEEYISNKTLIL